ncbi:FimB/Mfa2 family fimbrial subunit [Bacteroides oleiciplenus]|nr:FimB/Mfa2 family fimbrial subunit [Bacteroides oleiciplenus]
MKKAIILYILLLVTVTGCIKENLDDCETTLYFSYLGDETKEIFPQKIEKVDMYIYNQNNVCVQKAVLNRKELDRQRGTTLNLPSGQYHVVCWGNSLNDTRINEGSSLKNNIVGAPHYFTKELITTNDSLYFGEREITITNESYRTDTVHFSSAHIKMRIELEGLDAVNNTRAAVSPISIEVGNLSSTVDFTKTFSNERISYFPLVNFDSGIQKFGAKFNVLRFNNDNEVYLRLHDNLANKELYTMQLKDFMKENNIAVDGINEATIGIRIRFNGTAITVKPWDEEVIRPGL